MDIRAKRLADVILEYSLNIKKGESLLISGNEASIPFMKEVYKKAIDLGANPIINVGLDVGEYKLKHGSDDQIMFVPPAVKAMMETVDAMLTIMSSTNTRALTNVPAEKMKLSNQGSQEINEIFFTRLGTGEARWCGTLYPATSDAQEANMSLSEYEDFVYKAGLVDEEGSVEKWLKVKEEQDRICNILDKKKKLRIVAKDTDISMSVEGRTWVNCSGKMNFPDGEVFTGPVEDSVQGYIRFSYPGIFGGREIEDIRLKFEKGKVVEATAGKGEELLKQLINTDDGAKFVGEVAVGTNYGIDKFTKNMLFDEKIGGTVHMTLGRSIPESGGRNISSIHWDMLCDMTGGEIYADDELIYKDKKFII